MFIVYLLLFSCTKYDESSDCEVIDFCKKIKVGMPFCDVSTLYCKGNYKTLQIWYYDETGETESDELSIRTPMRIGASNWIIYILFKNDSVASTKIRTLDSKDIRPINAPPDRKSEL